MMTDILSDTMVQVHRLEADNDRLREENARLRVAVATAINEFHHPGACRYEKDIDILELLGIALKVPS